SHRHPHSLPTRRSSDLNQCVPIGLLQVGVEQGVFHAFITEKIHREDRCLLRGLTEIGGQQDMLHVHGVVPCKCRDELLTLERPSSIPRKGMGLLGPAAGSRSSLSAARPGGSPLPRFRPLPPAAWPAP